MTEQEFEERLIAFIIACADSQEERARAFNVSRQTIYEWLNSGMIPVAFARAYLLIQLGFLQVAPQHAAVALQEQTNVTE